MASPANPLLGWLGSSGTNAPNQFGSAPTMPGSIANPAASAPMGNPAGLPNPQSNIKDAWRNQAYLNTLMAQMRTGLGGQFGDLMKGYAGPAGNYFAQLMNLGSPYYQQQQRASWENVGQQSQNAAAQARQQLQASGAGYTPSGAAAGMFGGMAQAEAGNQAMAFLQNLFQNEQMQQAGAQGLAGLAGLFNPSGLLSTSAPAQATQGPTFGEQFKDIMGSIFKPINTQPGLSQSGG